MLEEENIAKSRCFYIDGKPMNSSHYIFDPTYKNVNEKKKFQKDPKFTYFNTLLKMKNSYRSHKSDLYGYIFTPDQIPPEKNQFNVTHHSFHPHRDEPEPKLLHVQKINSHAFKIYKGRRKNRSTASPGELISFNSNDDVNFKVHFKRSKKEAQKPQIQQVMEEYRRINERVSKQAKITNNSKVEIPFTRSLGKRNHFAKQYSLGAQGNLHLTNESRIKTSAKSRGSRISYF